MVRINDGKDVCLGTVLTPWKIVTSASCLYKKESVTLLVGPITSAEPVYSVNLTKGELYPHPRFDEKYPYVNNIGMIELSDTHRLKYDRNVGGIGWVDLLYKGPNNGEPVTIIQPDGKNPNVFRYTGSRLMDYDRCRKSYVAHFKRTFGGEYESLEEGRDLCVNSNGVANGVTGGINFAGFQNGAKIQKENFIFRTSYNRKK